MSGPFGPGLFPSRARGDYAGLCATPGPSFERGDIRFIRLADKFDAATALFHVISYQTTNEDLLAAFHTARAHLGEKGLFIFETEEAPKARGRLGHIF